MTITQAGQLLGSILVSFMGNKRKKDNPEK